MKSFCLHTVLICFSAVLCLAQPSPDTLWTRTYGGSNYDEAFSVQQTADGGYILAGVTQSFGAGGSDFYLVKTNSLGDTLWTRIYGGNRSDVAYSVQQTADGGYIVGGSTESPLAGDYDFYVVKTETEGPSGATVYLNTLEMTIILRWNAPQTCDYNIYTTTLMSEIGNPPGPGWSVAATLSDVPAGAAEWVDPSPLVPYKRYAVTMSCP